MEEVYIDVLGVHVNEKNDFFLFINKVQKRKEKDMHAVTSETVQSSNTHRGSTRSTLCRSILLLVSKN